MATGLYGNVKLLFAFVAYFIVDARLGRRQALIISSLITATAIISLGILINQMENVSETTLGIKQILAIIMLYIFAIGYEIGWGPVVWIVCSEIYPNNIRAVCISLTTTINFVTNAVIAKVCDIFNSNLNFMASMGKFDNNLIF
jgi:MFS family permease